MATSSTAIPRIATPDLIQDDVQDAWEDRSANVLEDYLDSIVLVPNETRRSLNLLRELDAKCEVSIKHLVRLQDYHVDMKQNAPTGDDTAIVKSIAETQNIVDQLIEEKCSIAQQLFDLSRRNVARAKRDLIKLEDILRNSGEMLEGEQAMLPPGSLCAAYTTSENMGIQESVWILARIVEWLSPKKVNVCDVDNVDSLFTVQSSLIIPLIEDEDVAAARLRLGQKHKEVLAIYPETTSFYAGQISGNPFRAGSDHGPLFNNKICVYVTFHDDEGADGVCPQRVVQALHVIEKP